jgi:hypothetical protein
LANAQQIMAARRKGLEWLLAHLNPDGSIGPYEKGIACYYRAPWTFAVTGRGREASRLLEWIRINMFSPEGDFAGAYTREDYDSFYVYPNANIIYGAQMLRQFDISYRGMEFLLGFQDGESGGFFTRREEIGPSGREDVWYSSQAGLTCLLTGRLREARKTGVFLRKVYDMQPDIENRLYNVYSPEIGLVTEFAEDEAKAHVVEASEPMQYFFQPGIAAAFLSRLYMATDEMGYLDLARKYMAFAAGCQHLFSAPQVCKVGWGAALLYQITKDADYFDLAMKVADYFIEEQHPEGYWLNIAPYRALPNILEITEEFVVHLDTIQNALAT